MYVTSKRVAGMGAFAEKFTKRFRTDLRRLGEAVLMTAIKFKRREITRQEARGAGQLPEPSFKGAVTRLELAPLHVRNEFGRKKGGGCEHR